MAKSKLSPALIAKAAARKAAFKLRKHALIRKMIELSILCDVPAILIIFWRGKREIWSTIPDPLQVIRSYIRQRSEDMFKEEEFLELEIKKLEDKLKKLELKNSELEVEALMYKALRGEVNLDDISPETASKLSSMLEKTMAKIKARISAIKQEMLLNDSPVEDSNMPSSEGDAEFPSDDHPSG